MSKFRHTSSLLNFLITFSLTLSGVMLIGFENQEIGWSLWGIGAVMLLFTKREFKNEIFLLFLSFGLLGITPITTDISYKHIALMGATLGLAAALPYFIIRFIYREDTIKYGAFLTRRWTKGEWMWLGFTLLIGYFLLPFYLYNTGSYLNWTVEPGAGNLFILFLGTNALGIWDELFFINTVLSILRKHFPFFLANLIQAILFTSFLYELGFRGWGPVMIFPFALAQGYVFLETKNLTYIISLHLALDLILYLALIHLHHPEWGLKMLFPLS